MNLPRLLATSLAVLALAVAGCGADDEPSTASSSGSESGSGSGDSAGGAAEATAKVDLKDFKFVPEDVKVKAGGEVTFANADEAKHNAQTDGGGPGAFKTKDLLEGDSEAITFEKPGKYSYYCIYHRFMTGTVEVSE